MKRLLTLLFAFILLTATAVQADPDLSAQLDLIAAGADTWKQGIDFGQWGYTAADLDGNGRTEIIAATLQGTGLYIYFNIYEVSEDGLSLTEITQDRPVYDSAPDIMMETVPVFFDSESGLRYYIFPDFVRNGYAESWQSKRAAYLENGVWKEKMLGQQYITCTDPEHCTSEFSDADGSPISEEAFNTLEDTCFEGLEKGTFTFRWNMTDNETFAAMFPEALRASLEPISGPADEEPVK